MLKIRFAVEFVLLLLLCGAALAQPTPEVRQYQVNYVDPANAPTIDGVDGDAAWAAAASGGDDWRLLREDSAPTDIYNNDFQMLWNSQSLFIRITTGNGDWDANPQDGRIDFGFFSFWMFLDPNKDGELNFDPSAGQGQSTGAYRSPDNYQFSFNTYDGFSQCGQDRMDDMDGGDDCSQGDGSTTMTIQMGPAGPSGMGTFSEAHIDDVFGNAGHWEGLRTSHVAQKAGANGAIVEMAIDWTDLDASAGGANDDGDGLNAEGAPANGDVWFANIGAVTTNPLNFLPVWNWHTEPNDFEFFASRPHGEITFVGRPLGVGDFDDNGKYECADVDALVAEIVAGTNDPAFDLNEDEVVDSADLDAWLIEAGTFSSGSPILAGDADLNGDVDGEDFLKWNRNKFTATPGWCAGDFDADGTIDGDDFLVWDGNKFQGANSTAAVPEPGLELLAAFCAAILLRRQRSSQSARC